MNSVGIFIVNAKLARKLKDRQLHFREEKVQLNFKFIVFFYGLGNVLLVNSVSTINTAPGEARVEKKLFFFVTCAYYLSLVYVVISLFRCSFPPEEVEKREEGKA